METSRIRITTEDSRGRQQVENIRHVPSDQVEARRQAVRGSMPRGSVFRFQVTAEK